jgi:hypothetical protein
MAKRLLDRQVSLLHYLTSGAAIFGDESGAARNPALRGIDAGLLKLEARFSHEKRMDKIAAVFRMTFALLGASREALVREFVDACPPVDIGRLENARQFHEFLSARWRHEPPVPQHLPDVANCELALATVRVAAEARKSDMNRNANGAPHGRIRRARTAVLLRSAYDIRPLFETNCASAEPVARDTRLAVVLSPVADQPEIFELPAAVFDLLSALDDWTDKAGFAPSGEAGELIAELASAGLVEVRP